jgi:hypothetical protein
LAELASLPQVGDHGFGDVARGRVAAGAAQGEVPDEGEVGLGEFLPGRLFAGRARGGEVEVVQYERSEQARSVFLRVGRQHLVDPPIEPGRIETEAKSDRARNASVEGDRKDAGFDHRGSPIRTNPAQSEGFGNRRRVAIWAVRRACAFPSPDASAA